MSYFFSKKALPAYIVWFVQLFPSYLLKVQAFSDKGQDTILYFLLEGFVWYDCAILITAGMQFLIDKFIPGKLTLWAKTKRFFPILILGVFAMELILWPILDVIYENIAGNQSGMGFFDSLPTTMVNIFAWCTWYISITLIELNREVRDTKLKNISLKTNLKESQLNTLKGQINPHFMFNSLNNIRGLILEDKSKARLILTNLSETLRYSLSKSDQNAIALEDELEMIENYISIAKIQFEHRLEYTENINTEALGFQIPPMILQILVENAIKHGISNLKQGGSIHLEVNILDEFLELKVINSGTLKSESDSTEVGLKNIRQRLNLLYGKRAEFNLKETDNLVHAIVKIPLDE
jgi:sensor histidine kinase YesM